MYHTAKLTLLKWNLNDNKDKSEIMSKKYFIKTSRAARLEAQGAVVSYAKSVLVMSHC